MSFKKMEMIHGCEQDLFSTWPDIAEILSLQIWDEQLQPLLLKQEPSVLEDGRDPRVRAGLVLHLRGHHPPHWQAQTGHLSRWGCFNNICIINYCYLLQTLFFRTNNLEHFCTKLKTSQVSTMSAELEVLFSDAQETLEQIELECHTLDPVIMKWWWQRWWWSWCGGRQWQWW